jgi:hypothetical protein
VNPQQPVDPIRPALKHVVDPKLLSMAPDRNDMPKEFIDNFDVIVVMHVKEWIINNWDKIKDKKVIWRTIGQSTPDYENDLFPYRKEGLKVVRYSKMEANIHNNIGSDMVIPFYKDPSEFKDWNGLNKEVITFAQNMRVRGEHCNFEVFTKIVDGFNAHVYGPNNENAGQLAGGYMSYDEMRQKMRDSRVYIYTGTQPASYTLNLIEAMMTGIPIVAIGPKWGNSLAIAGDTYEIPYIINNAVDGFWSDDIEELRQRVNDLLGDKSLAQRIGRAGRERAIELFGKDMVKEKWQNFFNNL